MTAKTCSECGKKLIVGKTLSFSRATRRQCDDCYNAKQRARRSADPEKTKEQQRKHSATFRKKNAKTLTKKEEHQAPTHENDHSND